MAYEGGAQTREGEGKMINLATRADAAGRMDCWATEVGEPAGHGIESRRVTRVNFRKQAMEFCRGEAMNGIAGATNGIQGKFGG